MDIFKNILKRLFLFDNPEPVKIHRKLYLLLLLILVSLFAGAQQYLVLQKTGTVKNIKYQLGNDITVQVKRGELVYSGSISHIKDSSFVLNSLDEIFLDDVTIVFRKRRFIRVMSKVLLYAGVGYIALEGVNGVINDYSPVISQNTIIASSVMVGTGLLMKPFYTRKYDTQEKYVLKVLDFEKFEMEN